MRIDKIHNWLNFITNKKLGTYFTPEENDDALDRAQTEEIEYLRSKFANTTQLHDSLSPFKSVYTFTSGTSPSGLITLPSDYISLLSVQCNIIVSGNVKYKGVKVVSEDELADRLNSQLRPVSASDPIATIVAGNKIQLYPEQAAAGIVRYLKQPVKPVFSYTQVGRVITYDDTTSVQMEWGDTELKRIIHRALQYLGLSVTYGELVQVMETKINS